MKFIGPFFFIFLSWHPLGLAGVNGAEIHFSELPKLVQERNENLKAAHASAEAQKERTGLLARSFLPQISAELGEEDFRTGSTPSQRQGYWRLGASINIYRGGRDRLDDEIHQAQLTVANDDVVREFSEELKKAQIAFWDLVAIEKLLVFRQEELKSNSENLKSSKRRAGAGLVSNADTVQFELNQMSLEQQIRRLELQRDLSRNQLSVLIGADEHKNLKVAGDFLPVSVDDFPALSVQDQPDVKSLQTREKIDELRASRSSRWWHPHVDLYAEYGLPSLTEEEERARRMDRQFSAGVKLSVDFSRSQNGLAESRAQELEARSKGYRAAHRAREVLAADHELRHDIQLLGQFIVENRKSLEKAKSLLRLTQGEYSRGLKNGPDLLSASKQLYGLQDEAVGLSRRLLIARAELEALLAREGGL